MSAVHPLAGFSRPANAPGAGRAGLRVRHQAAGA